MGGGMVQWIHEEKNCSKNYKKDHQEVASRKHDNGEQSGSHTCSR